MNPTETPAPVPAPQSPVQAQPEPQGTPANSEEYPIKFTVEYPEHQSRILALLSIPFYLIRLVLLIPHLIIMYVLIFITALVSWLNFWVILFTGHSSRPLYSFMVGSLRWNNRMSGYLYGLSDKYPPFGFKE